MAAPVVLGIARYLLGKNIKPLARQFGKFMKSKKFIQPKEISKLEKLGVAKTKKGVTKGPLKGKEVS